MRNDIWLIRVAAAFLLVCLGIRGAAFRHGPAEVVALYAAIGILLVALWLSLERMLPRYGLELSRYGVAVLAIGSAFALAIGRVPGLFSSSIVAPIAVVALIAIIAAVASGTIRAAGARALVVFLWTIAGAAWQLSIAPLLAMLTN